MAAALPLFGGWILGGLTTVAKFGVAAKTALVVGGSSVVALGVDTFLPANQRAWQENGIDPTDQLGKITYIGQNLVPALQQTGTDLADFTGQIFGNPTAEKVIPLQTSATPAVPTPGPTDEIQKKIDRLKELIGKKDLTDVEKEELGRLIGELATQINELLNNIKNLNPDELAKVLNLLNALKELLEKSGLGEELIGELKNWVESGLAQVTAVLIEKFGELLAETANKNPEKAQQILERMLDALKQATKDPTILAELAKIAQSLSEIKNIASAAAKSGALKALIGKTFTFLKTHWKFFAKSALAIWALNTIKDITGNLNQPQAPNTPPVQPQPTPTNTPNTVG